MKKTLILLFVVFILASCTDKNNTDNQNITEVIEDVEIIQNIEDIDEEKIISNSPVLKNVGIEEFKQELAKNDYILIDLRTTKELEETGIIDGAIQIDFYDPEFKNKLNDLDKNQKYLIYCRSGGRSGKTLNLMKELGFTNVYELRGGMNGWLKSGENTVKNNEVNENTEVNEKNEVDETSVVNDDMSMNDDVQINEITLNATSWEFDKKIIRVKKGEKLIINVNNIDQLHGIAIPDMQLVGDNQIEVDTSKTGEFTFQCANFCGEGHSSMTGTLIIV